LSVFDGNGKLEFCECKLSKTVFEAFSNKAKKENKRVLQGCYITIEKNINRVN